MTSQNISTILRRVAWSIAGLNLVMMLAALVLQLRFSQNIGNDSIDSMLDFVAKMLNTAIYTLLAVLIISRHPRHTIGWLFLAVGFFAALGAVPSVSIREHYINSHLVTVLLAALVHTMWIPAFVLPNSLVLQFFPDGRLPSQRWWPITAATLIGMCGLFALATSLVLYPWPWESLGVYATDNLLEVAGNEVFSNQLSSLLLVPLGIGMLGSLVAVMVRFVRSSGIERTQMKWLVYAAVVTVLLGSLLFTPIHNTLFLIAPTILSLAIGIAILRHHLWDIDIIIRRTLIYSALTVILAAVFYGTVVLLQQLFRSLTGQTSDFAIVLSTLAIYALFNPLRRQIQNAIDRRLYRRKYDVEKTLEVFNRTLRDEVDLDMLKGSLLNVVDTTMKPNCLALWVHDPSESTKNS